MRWVGWYRPKESAPWRRACEAESLGECASLLNEATRKMNLRSVNYFMTGGHPPPSMAPKVRQR
jgi:hypothetical protein